MTQEHVKGHMVKGHYAVRNGKRYWVERHRVPPFERTKAPSKLNVTDWERKGFSAAEAERKVRAEMRSRAYGSKLHLSGYRAITQPRTGRRMR